MCMWQFSLLIYIFQHFSIVLVIQIFVDIYPHPFMFHLALFFSLYQDIVSFPPCVRQSLKRGFVSSAVVWVWGALMCLSPLGTQCSSVCSALRSCIHCAFNLHGTFFFLKMNLMHWKVGKDHFHWITKSRLLWAEPSLTSSVMFSCIVCSLVGGVSSPLAKHPSCFHITIIVTPSWEVAFSFQKR